MTSSQSIRKIVVAGSFAVAAFLAVAASAAASSHEDAPTLTQLDFQQITEQANQTYYFN